MTPMQQMLLGVGAKKKVYMDDVFSTFLYEGNSTTRDINNGIDLAGEGGLVWIKNRDNQYQNNLLFDTTALPQSSSPFYSYPLSSNTSVGRNTSANGLKSFNSNGFSVYTDTGVNANTESIVSWSFRKAPGFFDVITYTGNGSNRTISHNLGTVPGMVVIKKTSGSDPWYVWHRDLSNNTKTLSLNTSDGESGNAAIFNSTAPTATEFSLGTSGHSNENNYEYVAYLFAGGVSNSATANSVNLDSDDSLRTSGSNDFVLDDDFTIEGWFKAEGYGTGSSKNGYFAIGNYQQTYGVAIYHQGGGIGIDWSNQTLLSPNDTAGCVPSEGQWYHVAIVRHNDVVTLYVNGTPHGSFSETDNWGTSGENEFGIGARWNQDNPNNFWYGKVSNVRVVKGTAIYTSSFRPPIEPLTNITNTKLLCCQSSTSATAKAVGPTITAGGGTVSATASTDSPFDDPAGFVFGDSGTENLIKQGSYIGDGGTGNTEIYLGFEPQWLLVKTPDASDDWVILDSMRGFATHDNQANDVGLYPNQSYTESTQGYLDLTSTGFKTTLYTNLNVNGRKYIYMAIRRPDGYVGKPPELGTDVFAMDTGASSSTIPNFDSGFPVDFALERNVNGQSWHAMARLIQGKYLRTDTNNAEDTLNSATFDSNVGFSKNGESSAHQAWMWKRHAGCDVVCYPGREIQGRQIPHSLNAVPEMIWVKNRTNVTENWAVYHKGLNGGTNPEQYHLKLNGSDAEADNDYWDDTAPTSTHFSVSYTDPQTNQDDKDYLAILFASVDGISKVGSYTGTSSNPSVTITTGFSPRLLIIKRADGTRDWNVFDTVRGIGTGSSDDKRLLLSSNAAQNSGSYVNVTSTGFTVQSTLDVGTNGGKYIYYAHA